MREALCYFHASGANFRSRLFLQSKKMQYLFSGTLMKKEQMISMNGVVPPQYYMSRGGIGKMVK